MCVKPSKARSLVTAALLASARGRRRHVAATVFLFAISGYAGAQVSALSLLKTEHPGLYRLYKEHESYVPALEQYANRQGFYRPIEHFATVVHEILHIASASHQGYYIQGVYYEPYITHRAWPELRNRDVAPYMRDGEKGIMYSVYMSSTPDNRLGNILDEVNAYTHVIPLVCKFEGESIQKQVTNLVGLLHIVEAYLRVARTAAPAEYTFLLSQRASSGALVTISEYAWAALSSCGVRRAHIPRQETEAFISRLSAK